jgi:hypothetical protein
VERLNAKLADCLANFNKEEDLMNTGWCKLLATVLVQNGRRMTLIGDERPDLSVEQTSLSGLLTAPTWEHLREKPQDPRT